MFCFGRSVRLVRLQQIVREAHYEPCRDPKATLDYVWKEETRAGEPFSFGELPKALQPKTETTVCALANKSIGELAQSL